MNSWHNFKTWRDIKEWAEKNRLKNLVARMDLNHKYWESSGEFGRSQVQICDLIRNSETEEIALKYAKDMDAQFEKNYGLWEEE